MKVFNHHTATWSALKFNSSILIFVMFTLVQHSVNAQTSKTFVKEIEVDENMTIISNVPSSIDLNMEGKVIANNTHDTYSINGKNNVRRLKILKDLKIDTWDRNFIKQETKISVKADTEEQATALLNQLNIELEINSSDIILIDCNLNIEKFSLKNGWLKNDDCKVKLENGSSHDVHYLSVETKLSIPKVINLSLIGEQHCTVHLGDLEGDLDLDLKYTEVYGSAVNNLNARLRWCYNVYFNKVKEANITATHSYIDIKNAEQIVIGASPISKVPEVYSKLKLINPKINDGYKYVYTKKNKSKYISPNSDTSKIQVYKLIHFNSNQCKYNFGRIGVLNIEKSMGDTFNASEVDQFDAQRSSYCSFKIRKLNTSAFVQAKSSDVSISKISKAFKDISVDNSLCDVDLMMEVDADYTLELDVSEYLEKYLAGDLEPIHQEIKTKEVYKVGDGDNGGKINIKCERCKFHFN